jgi:hypothetical protein
METGTEHSMRTARLTEHSMRSAYRTEHCMRRTCRTEHSMRRACRTEHSIRRACRTEHCMRRACRANLPEPRPPSVRCHVQRRGQHTRLISNILHIFSGFFPFPQFGECYRQDKYKWAVWFCHTDRTVNTHSRLAHPFTSPTDLLVPAAWKHCRNRALAFIALLNIRVFAPSTDFHLK